MKALGKGSIASIVQVGLQISWIVLWVAAGLLGLFLLTYIAVVLLIQNGALSPDLLEPGTQQYGPFTVVIDTEERLVVPLMAPGLLAAAVAVAGALIIVQRLRRLFKNFTSGEPFSRDNAKHLRAIWITMLVMELSRYAIWAIATGLVLVGEPRESAEIDSPVNFMTWGSILILIVLAEVFREGARLKEEQELTI
jgi:hypothetical protein